ncbi:carboxyl transferase domain-containing protein [Mycolicibacterium phlei]|uniref:carboxyl transferase domain-containing protein n=1 Tax=Mycolicibacterium phlei TaxID=1771 RepID=UPI00025ADD07|nr:carboxyl transferase domain-containing protein [Mycolicibacterium phlei]EID18206.1 acetyl-CoA carboxylase beta chain [Mycolicibacterium phlei RIVM601174]MBF4191270.1 acetyl-CoA carboxylase beta chain [Mycolicibacterium phlei]
MRAREVIAAVVDDGSWLSWDTPVTRMPADAEYAAELVAAREKTGLDEAVVTGEARIRGRRVAMLVCDFGFLGGSIGIATGQRLTAAIRRATAERLPLLALPTSGGTRMQEGTAAFLQMVRITDAVVAHKAAGLPYLVYLRHPTTGGVFASWGSLGHLTVAEPGALIGFLGPRVYSALYGEQFPAGVQTAENLYACGLVDAVAPVGCLAGVVDRVLTVLAPPSRAGAAAVHEPACDAGAWETVLASRRPDRPGVRDLLLHTAREVVPLNGTGEGEVDSGLLLALVRFAGAGCVLLGQDRDCGAPLGPAALRQARRGMRLAAELGLPLVTVIDTAGAALSREAEEGGLAGQIARCIADMVALEVPTVAVILGQGTGGGALALLPADRVLVAQHGWLSPLPPEGASAILHHDVAHAPEMAARQGVRAADLFRDHIVDAVIPECPDAADEPRAFCVRVGAAVREALASLAGVSTAERRAARSGRFDRIGQVELAQAG